MVVLIVVRFDIFCVVLRLSVIEVVVLRLVMLMVFVLSSGVKVIVLLRVMLMFWFGILVLLEMVLVV